jgi:hypothetical protein
VRGFLGDGMRWDGLRCEIRGVMDVIDADFGCAWLLIRWRSLKV